MLIKNFLKKKTNTFCKGNMKYKCPECDSEQVTLAHTQIFMANDLKHLCYTGKVQDNDSFSTCLDCVWNGYHDQLVNYKEMS